MSPDPAQSFADALQDLETTRDVDRFVAAVFTDDVELLRPETDQVERGPDGARRFWQQYLDQFEQIRSQFSRVVEGEVGVLEWTSSGRLSRGTDITYRGVTLLDVGADGRVARFATYYDTTPFALPGAAGTGAGRVAGRHPDRGTIPRDHTPTSAEADV